MCPDCEQIIRLPFLDLGLALRLADSGTSQTIDCDRDGPQAWTRLIEQMNFLTCKCKCYVISIRIRNMQCPLIGTTYTCLTDPAAAISQAGICIVIGIRRHGGAEGCR